MSPFKTFNKNKFLSFDIKKRHKKCAEILRFIYDNLLDEKPVVKKSVQDAYDHYNSLLTYLNMNVFSSKNLNFENISNMYHHHLDLTHHSLKEHNLLPCVSKNDSKATEEFGNICIYLDGIRSAFNVGNIIRTTEALRIGKIFFSEKTPFIDNDKVIKTSMGSHKLTPCERIRDISKLPRPIIALETGAEAVDIFEYIFPETFTLVLGNEEFGISDEILKLCDYILKIPLTGFKNSINVASAYAIFSSCYKKQKNYENTK
jgi:tRNA G18 (ribose-2'-O)-methylase SpoU